MNPIYICLIITTIIVYVYDYTAFPRNALARFYSIIFKREILPYQVKLPYLLQCSLCMTLWTTLIILAIMNWKLIPLSFLFSWSTTYIIQIFNLIDKFLSNMIKIIDHIIDKINF